MIVTNAEFDFETWFSNLSVQILDRTGVDFSDEESVREEYESGRCMYDVADEICAEYGDTYD